MKLLVPMSTSKTQHYINQAYITYIKDAGFEPIAVFQNASNLDTYVSLVDGLLLAGGVDIDPIYYDEDNDYCYTTDLEKDMFERSLLHKCIDAKKPVFGICRGFQLIAREFLREYPKLTEIFKFSQQIPGYHNGPKSLEIERSTPCHHAICADYVLRDGKNKDLLTKTYVNSMHHQGLCVKESDIFKKGPQKKDPVTVRVDFGALKVLAYTQYGVEAKEDIVVIEGIEVVWKGVKLRGVQWHPEELKDITLLTSFFKPKVMNVTGV